MRMIAITLAALFLAACNAIPDAGDAQNGVVCYEGSFSAPWNADARANGVRLDADVDVTQVSTEQWIQLYEAFCGGGQ